MKSLGGMSHAGSMGGGMARASDSKFKAKCRSAVFSNYFDRFILLIILLNCIQMALKGPDLPGETSSFTSTSLDSLDIIDMTVSVIFTIEALLKMWLDLPHYMSDPWSRLDLASVTMSWLSVVLDAVAPTSNSGLNLSAIRSLRAVRPLRSLRYFDRLRFIVEAAIRRLGFWSRFGVGIGWSWTCWCWCSASYGYFMLTTHS